MATTYIGLGGNVGRPAESIRRALELIGLRLGRVIRVSSLYRTEPVGKTDQPWFMNAAAAVETELAPAELLAGLLAVERELGRPELHVKYGPRTIDLDLLLYGDAVSDSPAVPHPRMHLRRFVLMPLGEIAPEAVHPVLGRTVAQLLAALDDPARVEKEAG